MKGICKIALFWLSRPRTLVNQSNESARMEEYLHFNLHNSKKEKKWRKIKHCDEKVELKPQKNDGSLS